MERRFTYFYSVVVSARTWGKNSFGLFNYHTKDLMVNSNFKFC